MVDLTALIEAEDVEALLFEVDVLCGDRDWDGLEVMAERCRGALERGRQLWPVASHVDYRLALEAPAAHAAAVLERSSRFTLGPLTEVAASTHSWSELAPHVPGPHVGAVIGQERILRREDLRSSPGAGVDVFELPLVLAPGETGHRLPEYHPHEAAFPDPEDPTDAVVTRVEDARPVAVTAAVTSAVRDLFEPWTAESDGTCRIAAGEADPAGVVGALAGTPQVRLAAIGAGDALVRLTWAGSSGGAHGRRRGGATGRFLAWWAAAALAGAGWPLDGVEELEHLSWCWWEPLPRPSGLACGLAVSDPATATSTAFWATG